MFSRYLQSGSMFINHEGISETHTDAVACLQQKGQTWEPGSFKCRSWNSFSARARIEPLILLCVTHAPSMVVKTLTIVLAASLSVLIDIVSGASPAPSDQVLVRLRLSVIRSCGPWWVSKEITTRGDSAKPPLDVVRLPRIASLTTQHRGHLHSLPNSFDVRPSLRLPNGVR